MTDIDSELEDADSTALLMAIASELSAIRQLLEAQEVDTKTTTYECDRCGSTVPEGQRANHAEQEHNAPTGMDVNQMFSQTS